jgi:hypothetical protein
MGRVLDFLTKNHPYYHNFNPSWADIRGYIETGDPARLARIPAGSVRFGMWDYGLSRAIEPPGSMGDEDRRALHILATVGKVEEIGQWLSRALPREREGQDLFGVACAEVAGYGVPPRDLVAQVRCFANDGRPNSAGRFLLGRNDGDLAWCALNPGMGGWLLMTEFLLTFAPDRAFPIYSEVVGTRRSSPKLCELLLRRGAPRYTNLVHSEFRALADPDRKLSTGRVLVEHDRERFYPEVLEAARAALAHEVGNDYPDPTWLVATFGADLVDALAAYLATTSEGARWPDSVHRYKPQVVEAVARGLGRRAIPALVAALSCEDLPTRLAALGHLITLDDGLHDERIGMELARGVDEAIQGADPKEREKVLAAHGPVKYPSAQYSPHSHSFLVGADPAEWAKSMGRSRCEYLLKQAGASLSEFVGLAGRWKPERLADRLWPLLRSSSKPVREAAARALGRIGAEAVPHVAELLRDRKADARQAAVAVLAGVDSPEALRLLKARLDEEPSDYVRDAILIALDAARGQEPSRTEIEYRIARTILKASALPADRTAPWVDEAALPRLHFQDGTPLRPEAVRYLLYRQSRQKEMRPDVEARPLYALIDRTTSGDFARKLLELFLASKAEAGDRWALAVAGLLGDDRVLRLLEPQIDRWAESGRSKMSEYAVQALALLATETTLSVLDAVSRHYQARFRNIGQAATEAIHQAATRLGISGDELADRIVPRLGFEPGRPRIVECGERRIEVRIGPDFKLKFRDAASGKSLAAPPKSAPKEVRDDFKDLAARLRSVLKAQAERLESLLIRQHRWPSARWRALYLDHPLLLPLAGRLVWGVYDRDRRLIGTLRALEDETLTDVRDEPFDLPDSAEVGIVHPLDLDEDTRRAWLDHLADYEVQTPFPQLERPVVRVPEGHEADRLVKDFDGIGLDPLTFKGRATRCGWVHGPVVDAGGVHAYLRPFPDLGVEAVLGLPDGVNITGDFGDATLGPVGFARRADLPEVIYSWNFLADETDPRLLPLGEVPPVVYSEVMGELARIAGRQPERDAVTG